MSELVKINAADYGLEESKAAQIAAQFKPMLDKMVELEQEYNQIISQPISKEVCAQAKELRMKYVKVRTGTEKIHKEQKSFYLAGGRYVDGWKNAQLFASQGIEEKLEGIEKHYANLEMERIKALQAERAAQLLPYGQDGSLVSLAGMTEDVWQNYLMGVKLAHEQRIEAERKAEEDRIAREKAEAEERERVRLENERLKAEAEQREKELAAERAKAEAERKSLEEKAAAERKAMEEAARKEREAAEAKAAKEREEQEAKIREERAKAEKLQAELKAKQEAEAKAAKEKADAEKKAAAEAKKAAQAPDKVKLQAMVDALSLSFPELKTEEAEQMKRDIGAKFEGFKKWAKEQIETL